MIALKGPNPSNPWSSVARPRGIPSTITALKGPNSKKAVNKTHVSRLSSRVKIFGVRRETRGKTHKLLAIIHKRRCRRHKGPKRAEFEKKLSTKLAPRLPCLTSKIWMRDVKVMITLPYRQEVAKAIAFARRLPPSAQDRNAWMSCQPPQAAFPARRAIQS